MTGEERPSQQLLLTTTNLHCYSASLDYFVPGGTSRNNSLEACTTLEIANLKKPAPKNRIESNFFIMSHVHHTISFKKDSIKDRIWRCQWDSLFYEAHKRLWSDISCNQKYIEYVVILNKSHIISYSPLIYWELDKLFSWYFYFFFPVKW